MVVEYSLLKQLHDELNSILKNNIKTEQQQETTDTHKCSKCGIQVDQKVLNFCTHPTQQQKFGSRILCRECQKEESS